MSVAGVAQWACGAIRNLSVNNDNSAALGRAGACEAVVGALQQHMSVAGVAQWACGAILSLRSEEHTSELQSLMRISYAVFCLNTKILIMYPQYVPSYYKKCQLDNYSI